MSTIDQIINKYTSDVEQTVKEALTAASPFICGVISYHFGWVDQNFEPANFDSGKMLRPTFCLLVFDALTGRHKPALPVAAAIEMIHNFSLIHDDIEDNDLARRGRPTMWTIWGKPLAINAGDFLYTLAFNCLHTLDPTQFAPKQILAVQRLISRLCLELTLGQDLDLRFEQAQNVTVEMYIDMVYKKTGALLEAAILSGAMLGTEDEATIANYRDFAQNIGIAFQVRDDILGIWGDASKTGKSIDNDLRRKKKTLPVIYTLNKVTGTLKHQLDTLYTGPNPLTDDEISWVRDIIEQTNAYQYTQNMADTYIENAFAALDKIDNATQAQLELKQLTRFLIDRSH